MAEQRLQLTLDFGSGRVPGEKDTLATWRESRKFVEGFLEDAGYEGAWSLRPVRKNRWRSNSQGQLKLISFDEATKAIHICVHLTGRGNVAWEFAVVPPAGTNGQEVFDQLFTVVRKSELKDPLLDEVQPEPTETHTNNGNGSKPDPIQNLLAKFGDKNAKPKAVAPASAPAPAPVAPTPTGSSPAALPEEIPSANRMRKQLDVLEQAAARERARRARIAELQTERESWRKKIEEAEKGLTRLDELELELLDASEKDKESHEAVEALKALSRFFTPSGAS